MELARFKTFSLGRAAKGARVSPIALASGGDLGVQGLRLLSGSQTSFAIRDPKRRFGGMTELLSHSMLGKTRGHFVLLQTIGRFIAKGWIALLAVPALAAFRCLGVILGFAAHQREF